MRSGVPGYFSESVISPSYEGHDGLRLWDLESLRELRPPWVPGDDARYRGQVTCVAWLPEWSNARKTVCFGTALGYIVFWRQTGSVSTTSSPLSLLLCLLHCSSTIGRRPRGVLERDAKFYPSLWIPEDISLHGSLVERATKG